MITYFSGQRGFTQPQMDTLARQAAGGFAALGIVSGDAVALLMANEIEMIACSQALSILGAYSVPINWHSTPHEIGYILADSDVKALVAHAPLAATAVAAAAGQIPVVSVPLPDETARDLSLDAAVAPVEGTIDWAGWIAAQAPWDGAPQPARPAIIYTSGTTGKPKGVMRDSHASAEALAAQARNLALVWGAEDGMRTLILAPLYHSAPSAYLRSAIGAMTTGGDIRLIAKFEPEAVLQAIERDRITHMWMVPTMFIRLLQLPAEVRAKYDVSSLRNIIHSAAPCPLDVKLQMIDWFGPVINEFYGQTETGPLTYVSATEFLTRPGTAGRVMEGCRIAILDDAGAILPAGREGEIAGANETYARFTYRNRQDERDGLDAGGLILTGDIGYIDADGYLFVKDRKKDMVISGGVNIYPAEIEDVLLRLDNVSDGAVFGVPHPVFGETIMAAVTLRAPEPAAPERLRAELQKLLSGSKVPREILVIEDFPRDASGKVYKHKLRKMVTEGSVAA